MANIDTSIYGQIQPMQPVQNPLAQLGQLAQLQHYQAQAGKSQRDEERQNRLYGLVASPEFAKMDAQGKAGALQGVGAFDEAGKVVTSNAAANKDTRAAEQTQLEMAIKRNDALSGAMQRLSQNPNEAPMVLRQMVDSQIIAPDYAQKIMQGAQGAPDPAQFFAAGAQAAVSAKDQLAQQIQKQGQAIQVQGQQLTSETARRGQDMTDTRAREANVIAANNKGGEGVTNLRKEFNALPEVKNYTEALPAFKAINDAASRNTPQSDINLVYGVAKLYDPTSVVREGEYATVANAQSIPEHIKKWAQYIQGGGRLTPETKRQILEEANGRMQTFQEAVEQRRTQYGDIATRTGVDPTLVLDQGYKPPVAPKGGNPAGGAVNRKTINGVTYENDGKGWYKAD